MAIYVGPCIEPIPKSAVPRAGDFNLISVGVEKRNQIGLVAKEATKRCRRDEEYRLSLHESPG